MAHGELDARMQLEPDFMAPNGYMHAGTVVSMADSCCGEGCLASLPDGMAGFTTSELKTNFLRSAAHGDALLCEARMVHEGPHDAGVGRRRCGASRTASPWRSSAAPSTCSRTPIRAPSRADEHRFLQPFACPIACGCA